MQTASLYGFSFIMYILGKEHETVKNIEIAMNGQMKNISF